ncbi:MAG: DCC1-like thiol-disulfide oxidoreductase family protein [Lentilitoribacter sp.]
MQQQITKTQQKNAIWLFDSVCVLCNGAISTALRYEKAPSIDFVSIHSPNGRAIAQKYNIDPDDPDTFLFLDNGRPYVQSDGVIALSKHMKAPFSWIRFGVVLPKAFRDTLYHLVARNRYRLFGKLETCRIPTEAERSRFTI